MSNFCQILLNYTSHIKHCRTILFKITYHPGRQSEQVFSTSPSSAEYGNTPYLKSTLPRSQLRS